MALAISTNFAINANTALNAMNKSQSLMGKSISRISTGNRAANPADDPLSYFSGNQIKGDTDGYQALYNGIQDGAARINVADTALSSMIDVLTEMKSKAIAYESLDPNEQSGAAGTAISNAYKQLYSSLDSFASATYKASSVWSTSDLSFTTSLSTGGTEASSGTAVVGTGEEGNTTYTYATTATATNFSDIVADATTGKLKSFTLNGKDFIIGSDNKIYLEADGETEGNEYGTLSLDTDTDPESAKNTLHKALGTNKSSSTDLGSYLDTDVDINVTGTPTTSYTFGIDSTADNDGSITELSLTANVSALNDSTPLNGTVILNGTSYNIVAGNLYASNDPGTDTTTKLGSASYDSGEKTLTVNVDAVPGGTGATLSVGNMTSPSYNASSDISVTSSGIQNIINNISKQRTALGGSLSAMDAISSYLSSMTTANEAAYTAVTEANIAKEMTSYVKNNVYSQAAQAMISQANQSLAQVLNLLQ